MIARTAWAGVTLWLLAAGPLAAEDRVYRCGADGRHYSQQPCASGQSIDVADARSMLQVREAQQVAARDVRLAETLAQERKQRERAASRQGASHIGSSRSASAPEGGARGKAPRKGEPRRARDGSSMTPPLKAFTPPA